MQIDCYTRNYGKSVCVDTCPYKYECKNYDEQHYKDDALTNADNEWHLPKWCDMKS